MSAADALLHCYLEESNLCFLINLIPVTFCKKLQWAHSWGFRSYWHCLPDVPVCFKTQLTLWWQKPLPRLYLPSSIICTSKKNPKIRSCISSDRCVYGLNLRTALQKVLISTLTALLADLRSGSKALWLLLTTRDGNVLWLWPPEH